MKKVLLCAGLIVLATSCNQDEFLSLENQKDVNGITFEAVEGVQSRIQWDETETSYSPYWHAEVDRVNIYSTGVNRGYNSTNGAWTNTYPSTKAWWGNLGNKVEYKATQSAKAGKFTSKDDANMLGFAGDVEGKFFAVYPTAVTVGVSGKNVEMRTLPALNEQTQTGLKGQNPAIIGWAKAPAKRAEAYNSVGETVGLSYNFPLAALVMKTKNANTYTTGNDPMFGQLDSITVQAKGYDTTDTANDIKASRISYASGATIKVDTVNWASTIVPGTAAADSAKIKLNIKQKWNDNALAMAAILPVDRSETFSAEKPETFLVTFHFNKISLQSPYTTVHNNFEGFMEFPALDIEDFDYLVTNKSAGANDRTLIVNKGTFAQIISSNKVVWPAGSTNLINPSEFSKIVVNNIALTTTEAQMLALFTNATSITLEETTALPANTFVEDQMSKITTIDMPKVTSIDAGFIKNTDQNDDYFTKLNTLKLASYAFETPAVNAAFFTVKDKLETLDMSGVENMLPTFGIDRSLSFENFTALKYVTVQNGMKVAPKGFMGCTNLLSITGSVNMINGDEAFVNAGKNVVAGNADPAFRTINVTSTVIPYKAFMGATYIKNVLVDGNQVAPTKVGESAFENTAVEYMDLANLEIVGKQAFKGSALKAPNATTQIMSIGATEIGEYAFQNTSLYMVNFTNATTIAKGMLKGVSTLVHLKFTKAFTVSGNVAYDSPFGANTNKIDLFINPDQKYMSGTIMKLPYGTTPSYDSYTFKTVQKE